MLHTVRNFKKSSFIILKNLYVLMFDSTLSSCNLKNNIILFKESLNKIICIFYIL